MRYVPLHDWKPTPHHAYFMHVASNMSGDACGLVLVRAGSGRVPCRGVDRFPDDDYTGDVFLNSSGQPIKGTTVQYFQQQRGVEKLVAETTTDDEGRHSLKIEPGEYSYRYVLPIHGNGREFEGVGPRPDSDYTGAHSIVVEHGYLDKWEIVPDAENDVSGTLDTPEILDSGRIGNPYQMPTHMAREVGFVTEDLICEWSLEDNEAFSWQDVEETIARINQICAQESNGITQITFNRFARPDVIATLQRRGVNAVELKWPEQNLASAYRNLGSMIDAEFIELLCDGVAAVKRNIQIRRNVKFADSTGTASKRAGARQAGQETYLAEATAIAVYFAAQEAAYSPHGAALPFWNMMMEDDVVSANPIQNAINDLMGRGW